MGNFSFLKLMKPLIVSSAIIGNVLAASFTDEHNDGSQSGWSTHGSRQWLESGTNTYPASSSSQSGFLISNNECSADGTLEVTMSADTWNGQKGGVVFRWNSTSSFYFVALQPGNQYSNYLKFVKNSLDVNSSSAITVASNFVVDNTFNLKIIIEGNRFDFYVNGEYKGSVTDATHASGKTGYGYSAEWNSYTSFDRIQWTETSSVPDAPSNLTLNVISSSQINLSWNDNSSNESGFKIERAIGNDTFAEIKSIPANTTSYEDTGLSVSTLYRYRVKAYNSSNQSAYSNEEQAATNGDGPVVFLTSPQNNATFNTPASILINADAYDENGSIVVVQFFNGSNLLYSDFEAPYSYQWENVPQGNYQIKAVAWNNRKIVTQSHPVTIGVENLPTKFLIIASSPLYRMGNVASMLAEYQEDILEEGWASEIITVNTVQDQYADYSPVNEVQLKNIISTYYDNGLEGILFVGNAKDIPTAYWHYHERDPGADPSDLFYADMDQWIDLNGDDVYETFHSKLVNNTWKEDTTRPANPANRFLKPDLIYGRISPDTSVCLREQFYMVCRYLSKIHSYRNNNLELTPEQKNRSLYLINEDYAAGMNSSINLQSATPEINVLAGYNLVFPQRMMAELSKGFMHAQIISHSGNLEHATASWKNEIKTSAGFSLKNLKESNAKVYQVNLFNCSAARYNVPNFGATYIFDTDYTLTVTGSTGGWGTWMNKNFYTELNNGVPVGKAYCNWLQTADDGTPKGVLHGDPLITYTRSPLLNSAPVFSTRLFSNEATAGVPFNLDITAVDPDYDPVSIELSDLPDGAYFNGTTLSWTPAAYLAGTSDTIIARVTDDHNNCTEQAFILYVSHFRNGMLENTEGWNTTGSGQFGPHTSDISKTPYGVPVKSLQTSNSYISISQSVQVKPDTRYRFSFWSNNQLTQNENCASVKIEELNRTIKASTDDGFVQSFCNINTGNLTSLTITLNNGTLNNPTDGRIYYTLLRLVEEGQFSADFENGTFEIGSDNEPLFWFTDKYITDNSDMSWEPAGCGRNGRCVSITNTKENDSRWFQIVSGLNPGSLYRVQGFVKGENIVNVTGNVGANLCILGTFEMSQPQLTGTFDWTQVEFTFTAPQTGFVKIGCRLGHNGSTSTGKAYFDDITVTKVN